jgi:hypothetical protein
MHPRILTLIPALLVAGAMMAAPVAIAATTPSAPSHANSTKKKTHHKRHKHTGKSTKAPAQPS